jgi:hypothetical protein
VANSTEIIIEIKQWYEFAYNLLKTYNAKDMEPNKVKKKTDGKLKYGLTQRSKDVKFVYVVFPGNFRHPA